MKKLVVLLLVCILFVSCAAADDLSGLSFDDLVKLRDEINAEIVSRPEWKETTVPPGDWVVGQDIPVGVYSIRNADSVDYAGLSLWRVAVHDYSNRGYIGNIFVENGEPYGRLQLEAGWVVSISNPVVFAPPQGLGF